MEPILHRIFALLLVLSIKYVDAESNGGGNRNGGANHWRPLFPSSSPAAAAAAFFRSKKEGILVANNTPIGTNGIDELWSSSNAASVALRGGGAAAANVAGAKKHNLPTLLYGPSDQIPPKAGPLHIFPTMLPLVFKYLDLAFQLTFVAFGWLLLTSTAAQIWKVISVVHGLSLVTTTSYGGDTTPHGGKSNPWAKFPLKVMFALDCSIVATAVLTPLLGVDGYSNGPMGDLRWLFYALGPAGFFLLTSFDPAS